MPPRPLLTKPPAPPQGPLPKSPAPSWFDKLLATVQGATGLPLTSPEFFEQGGESLDRYSAAGELGSMLSLGSLGIALARKGAGLAQGSGKLADLGKRIPNPIKAYHGSPHDFDQFSLEKIGTGEGAQAYGHGLYFAENPEVAQGYREALSQPSVKIAGQRKVMGQSTDSRAEDSALAWVEDASVKGLPDPLGHAIQQLKMRAAEEKTRRPQLAEMYEEGARIARQWKQQRATVDGKGRTYEVNIHASPDELLDWDKPLSEQPQKVREALASLRVGDSEVDGFKELTRGAEGVSMLREKGIKGIQYLDQGSRASGTGTRNFVIFDDQLIEIAKKYGIPLAMAQSFIESQGGRVESR